MKTAASFNEQQIAVLLQSITDSQRWALANIRRAVDDEERQHWLEYLDTLNSCAQLILPPH